MSDTIAALASGRGTAGVAVIRISGPDAPAILRALCGSLPLPRRASLRALRRPDGAVIDRGLVLFFPGPDSFTGEDVAELHVHGGRAVIAACLEAVTAHPGCRMAEPGEFSRRAFAAGKLDLTQAEGIADLVAAETEAQRRQALRQMDGALGALYEDWRGRLLRALAHIEAEIEFPDEDVPTDLIAAMTPELSELAVELTAHLDDDRRGERLRDGIVVAILGPPNVGKSSLLNALARREAAIVADQAGTTRDVIEVALDLGGYPVRLADTAGLRVTAEAVEAEGVRRAQALAEAADLRLVMTDATAGPPTADLAALAKGGLLVANKMDRPGAVAPPGALPLSLATGAGLDALLAALTDRVATDFDRAAAAPLLTQARHRSALQECLSALRRAPGAAAPELLAEDVRLAARALGRITGRVDVQTMLDIVFRDFCIGK